ncbi:MAG: DUF1579 domain-containing protein [Ginsengibacter sp.]
MKQVTLIISAISLFIFSSTAQQGGPVDQAAMEKAWQAYMTPGDVHKMLAKSDGEWTEDITMWMVPGAPPEKTTATVVNKMILGGRYQQSIHKGTVMGQPFEGMGTLAYDNAKKTFVSTWADNMGTGIMVMEGPWDDATKTINMKGKQTEPMTGKDMDMRQTFKIIDDNTQQLEMFATQNGTEYKTMEIKLKRK